jgi:CXXX repeat radical SAM target protein
MKEDFSGKPDEHLASQFDDKKSRREFLTTAVRVILPTLGLLGISFSEFKGIAGAYCNSICTGGCQGACTSCTGSCSGICEFSCEGVCRKTCYNTCRDACTSVSLHRP